MSIDETIYKFKLKYDKLDTKQQFNLSIPQILLFLNEAQRRIVNRKYDKNNIYKLGFQEKQKRIRELQKLLRPTETLSATKIDDFTYTSDLNSLSYPLLFVTRSQSIANREGCEDGRVLNNIEVLDNDLNNILKDPHNKPSYNWEETPVGYRDDKIYVYSDGTFTITDVKVDGIREPKEMDKTGYLHFDGIASINQDPELPDYVVDEIINESVFIASIPIEATELAQGQKAIQSESE